MASQYGSGKKTGKQFWCQLALVPLLVMPCEEKRRTRMLSVTCLGRHIGTPQTAAGLDRGCPLVRSDIRDIVVRLRHWRCPTSYPSKYSRMVPPVLRPSEIPTVG
jgi:hypothetical protein